MLCRDVPLVPSHTPHKNLNGKTRVQVRLHLLPTRHRPRYEFDKGPRSALMHHECELTLSSE